MRILVIGLSRDLPLGPADAMELADHLVRRAAAVQADGEGPRKLCPGPPSGAASTALLGRACLHSCVRSSPWPRARWTLPVSGVGDRAEGLRLPW